MYRTPCGFSFAIRGQTRLYPEAKLLRGYSCRSSPAQVNYAIVLVPSPMAPLVVAVADLLFSVLVAVAQDALQHRNRLRLFMLFLHKEKGDGLATRQDNYSSVTNRLGK